MEPVNVHEFEAVAREVMPQASYDYYAGGADDELTVAENRAAFARRHIRYRTLVDVSSRDLSISILGIDLSHPILLAPTALHKLAHPEGEAETARGAAAASALQTVSTVASLRLEDVMSAAPENPKWFQLYCYGSRELTESLVKRAYASGYKALVVTVDVPVLGRRERDLRNTFVAPPGVTYSNFEESIPRPEGSTTLTGWATSLTTDRLTWETIEWLRSITPMPTILKGIVRADEAVRAAEMGIEGVWVSNHGGRQLDGSIPTLDALAEIAPRVRGRTALIVDGGVRRGTDVLKALALGAGAVAIGRPQLWGLAAGGAGGVQRVVEMLRDELSMAMALAGCPSIKDITPDLIA